MIRSVVKMGLWLGLAFAGSSIGQLWAAALFAPRTGNTTGTGNGQI